MDQSPQKRLLTESIYQENHQTQRRPGSELLPDDLVARLANVGRRVRYNVSQGYASNRSTPLTTPNVSPSKPPATSTPSESPTRRNIFKTEFEVIQEAALEVEKAKSSETDKGEDKKPKTSQITESKKRRREDDEEDDWSEDADEEDYDSQEEKEPTLNQNEPSPNAKRTIKTLPKHKPPKVTALGAKSVDLSSGKEVADGGNPFLVSSSKTAK
ncbi:hypothetical protein FRC18_002708 [Serendipita sp. 400]|nr:hypothetical protein FRC18_002708 [Serendipita sp. 400]